MREERCALPILLGLARALFLGPVRPPRARPPHARAHVHLLSPVPLGRGTAARVLPLAPVLLGRARVVPAFAEAASESCASARVRQRFAATPEARPCRRQRCPRSTSEHLSDGDDAPATTRERTRDEATLGTVLLGRARTLLLGPVLLGRARVLPLATSSAPPPSSHCLAKRPSLGGSRVAARCHGREEAVSTSRDGLLRPSCAHAFPPRRTGNRQTAPGRVRPMTTARGPGTRRPVESLGLP